MHTLLVVCTWEVYAEYKFDQEAWHITAFGRVDGRAGVFQQASVDPAASGAIEEIVVTANKREQKLSDVGMAVSVLSGDTLRDQQINSLAELANAVPGLSFTTSANSTPVLTLRGVGFYETSLAAYPAVSLYVDEVPLPFPVLTSHSAYDLERLEILKGPQGTLFGENSTGGAINYIAAKPTRTFSSGAELSYGRFNEAILDSYVSGPLTDNLQARVSAHIERSDGWQNSNSRPGDTNGEQKNYSGRVQLAFQPSDALKFIFNVNGWQDLGETQAPQFIGFNLQNPVAFPALLNSQLSPLTPQAADWTPGIPYRDNHMVQTSLRGDLQINPTLALTSVTAYVDYKQTQGDEGDGLPISDVDLPQDDGNIKSFYQELRLSNGGGTPLRWLVGGNYEHSKVFQQVFDIFPASTSTATFGAIGYPLDSTTYNSNQTMTNYAGFESTEYDLLPTVTLKGGVRYTNAKTSVTACNFDDSGEPGNSGPLIYNVLLGGAFGPYVKGDCFQINDQKQTIGGIPPGAPGEFQDTLHQDNVSWRVGADWKPQPGMLAYVNVAKGYKAGGFPALTGTAFTSYLPVQQESVQSYEIGFKASALEHKLQFEAAAFYYDYKDKQLRSKVAAPPFGILDTLQNIPKSNVKGVEFEATWHPIRDLSINAAFTYLDAKIEEFVGINAAGVAADFADTRVPFTPKYQGGINADYSIPLTSNVSGFVGSSVTYRSSTVSVVGGDTNPPASFPQRFPLFNIDGYTLANFRVGVKSPDDHWRAWVWDNNAFNKYYYTNVVQVFDTISRYTGRPAEYGVSVSYKF